MGEVRAGLRAADCALFVVAANEGVDDGTRQLWRECAAVGMPRAVVVAKLDHARADADAVVAAAQEAFGGKVLPVHVATGGALTSLLDGDTSADDPRRGTLIEAIIEESEDETLMDRYLGGERIDERLLVDDLEKAIARAGFFPVVPVCAASGVGLEELLDLCVRAFPSPPEHVPPEVFTPAGRAADPVVCDPDGPLVAEVVKTTSDPYLGRVSLVRVFSGTLLPRRRGARVGPLRQLRRRRSRGPRRGRAGRRPRLPVRRPAGDGAEGAGRRHRRGGPALPRGDGRHALRPRVAPRPPPLGAARPAAPPSRSRPPPGPTRTSCPPRSPGWRRRTPACGSSTTPRPASS
ncbi:GTP-binding protein [Nocardioides sp. TF02-7]|uniref:GTP-binding protein n=1 Tax=Nocardioides sp. TF02-7 TaxID=2917724 RepID=UPI0023DAACC7|nr:GTP-binding protein [Nocardioides sp. TF02-7]